MSRSLKKGPYVDEKLIAKVQSQPSGTKEIIKTWARNCTITPEMIGFTFGVHNGKDFLPVYVNEEMVGHRLGEFSATTRFSRHGGKMQRELETKAAETEAAKVQAVKTAEAKPAK
ncbi:MAG: 30S ribosomal protein S19 [Candidatus Nealsonbacteria bacterium]|nr:30S ribosomal protein S19 [Candidatus Nealsonbacteria bacterium]